MTPRVSVIMAVHNGERYLREAISSILGQTFTDFEFIIIDDGSSDQSPEIILSFNDPRIIFLRNERNLGLTISLNRGLDVARGDYIARMDSDDISLPERLAKQVAFMDAHPQVGACSTWALDINEAGQIIGERNTLVGEQLDNFYWRTSLIHPAAMIRFAGRDDLRYDQNIRYSQDYDFWLRIRSQSKLENLPEHLLLYRVHQQSITATRSEKQITIAYEAFCRHIGTRAISYKAFLSLMSHSLDVNPVSRAIAMARLARRIHKPYRVYRSDDYFYAKQWLESRDLYRALREASLFRFFRHLQRRVGF